MYPYFWITLTLKKNYKPDDSLACSEASFSCDSYVDHGHQRYPREVKPSTEDFSICFMSLKGLTLYNSKKEYKMF